MFFAIKRMFARVDVARRRFADAEREIRLADLEVLASLEKSLSEIEQQVKMQAHQQVTDPEMQKRLTATIAEFHRVLGGVHEKIRGELDEMSAAVEMIRQEGSFPPAESEER
jgi:hypothetical protein